MRSVASRRIDAGTILPVTVLRDARESALLWTRSIDDIGGWRNALRRVSTKRAFREHGIDVFRVGLDDAQQYLRGRIGTIASLLPVLNRIQFETEAN
jgi:hypothetical protein